MAEFPALPVFTDAYLADTRHLTAAQHGAYFLLLMTAWRRRDCALPDDDAVLAKFAAMDARTWIKNKPVIMAFWRLGDDHVWRQDRLSRERNRAEYVRSKNAEAGRASALKRQETCSTTVATESQRNVNPLNQTLNHTQQTATGKKAARGGANETGIVTEAMRKGTAKGHPFHDPARYDGAVLPGPWQDVAEARGIPDDQIFRSWGRFVETHGMPAERPAWVRWVENERF